METALMTVHDPSHLFSGPERLEFVASLGRVARVGAPAELGVSDAVRLRAAIERQDGAQALAYLDVLHPLYELLLSIYLEWSAALVATAAKQLTPEVERGIMAAAVDRWGKSVPKHAEADAAESLRTIFSGDALTADTVQAIRNGSSPLIGILHAQPSAALSQVKGLVSRGQFAEALVACEAYLSSMRARHDLLCLFPTHYIAVLVSAAGQARAERIMQESFNSCTLVEMLWQFVEQASPESLAHMLAEHLRSHFSGAGREGAVEIREEADCYRLIFAPCGSGGAMRREHPDLPLMPEASPGTWHLSGKVPTYCAHCAHNELSSIRRLGYPAWVTEFRTDPWQPCGWTVYKNRSLIPERYFTRLGVNGKPVG